MEPDPLEQQIGDYVDSTLSTDDGADLAAALAGNEAAIDRLIDQQALDRCLRERARPAIDSAALLARLDREATLADRVMHRVARDPVRRQGPPGQRPPASPFTVARWATAALVMLAIGGAAGWWSLRHRAVPAMETAAAYPRALDGPELARPRILAAADAQVRSRAKPTQPAAAGSELESGDQVVSADGGVELGYADGTRVRLDPGTRIQVDTGANDAKSMRLVSGGLRSSVAPQPANAPLQIQTFSARAVVVGTEFTLTIEPIGTRLVVHKGTVQLADAAGRSAIAVTAGQQALASPRQLPALDVPVDASAWVTRPVDACDDPAAWRGGVTGHPLTVTLTADHPAGGSGCLRFSPAAAMDSNDYYGTRGVGCALGLRDRALRFRLRVERAEPTATVFVDVQESNLETWRLAGWPVSAGGGWRTITIPLPPPGRPPENTYRTDGTWQVDQVRQIFIGFSSAAVTFCIDEVEVLSVEDELSPRR